MQFIVDNYIWFIAGGVVLLMAIIGFFADRTDFGRKEFQKRLKEPKEKTKDSSKKETSKKGKVEEVTKGEVPIKIPDDALVDDVVNEENDNLITEDLFQVLPTETTHESIAIDNNDLYKPLQSDEQVNHEDLYKPLQSDEQVNHEDLYKPLQSDEQVNHEDLYKPLQSNEQVNHEDLYQPLQSDEQVNHEDLYQPLQSDEQVSYSNDLFKPLEDTSKSTSNETDNNFVQSDDMNNTVDSEEDIWKF